MAPVTLMMSATRTPPPSIWMAIRPTPTVASAYRGTLVGRDAWGSFSRVRLPRVGSDSPAKISARMITTKGNPSLRPTRGSHEKSV